MSNNDIDALTSSTSPVLGIVGAFLASQSVDPQNAPKIDWKKILPKRRKSKKDKQIEKLEEERDYWKRQSLRDEDDDSLNLFRHWDD